MFKPSLDLRHTRIQICTILLRSTYGNKVWTTKKTDGSAINCSRNSLYYRISKPLTSNWYNCELRKVMFMHITRKPEMFKTLRSSPFDLQHKWQLLTHKNQSTSKFFKHACIYITCRRQMTYEPHCDDHTMADRYPSADYSVQQNSVPAATCYVFHWGPQQRKYLDFLKLEMKQKLTKMYLTSLISAYIESNQYPDTESKYVSQEEEFWKELVVPYLL